MTEEERRNGRVCFTGNRPEKLTRDESAIRRDLAREIVRATENGFWVFITGMARGVDLWAAQEVLRLQESGWPVHLICAVPYEGFECCWTHDWQKCYHAVLGAADLVRYISCQYSPGCFQRRNRWMVDHAARIIAVDGGVSGGTQNTLAYAAAVGVPAVIIKG